METRNPDDDEKVSAPTAPGRPTGRDGVRRAVLRAARQLVAARGPRVPLRDIADAAGVNLGLIHRHVGRKEDLLTEVLNDGVRHGAEELDGITEAGEAIRTMLLRSTEQPDYNRLLLWLALDPDAVPSPEVGPPSRPANVVREMMGSSPAEEARLALALTVVYAWPVMRSQILTVLDVPAEQQKLMDYRVADLLGGLVTGDSPGSPGSPDSPGSSGQSNQNENQNENDDQNRDNQ